MIQISDVKAIEQAVTKISRVSDGISTQKAISVKNYGKGFKTALGVSAVYMGVGASADLFSKAKDKHEGKKQRARDLKVLKKTQRDSSRKSPNKIVQDITTLPFDLFNDRIGHTNMGNAKF